MRTAVSLVILALLALVLYRLWPSRTIEARPEPPSGPALRVLFVGNSHTYRNDMPAMIAQLAAAARERPFFFRMEAPGGAKLVDHVASGRVAALLAAEQPFDYVVLQEQQQWPSFGAEQRKRELEAPASTLHAAIRAANAKTLLYLTWARRDGDPENRPGDTYMDMQARMRIGLRDAAVVLGAPVVAVGLVWQNVVLVHPELQLWEPDGSHATALGSYLAACVFYKALYGRSPEGNPYRAGLEDVAALRVQRAAGAAQALYAPAEL